METRSQRRKRRRLISISSNVSSWPHVPARFESLNDDTLTKVLEFVGDNSYRSFGGLNYHCKEIYIRSGMTKKTFVYGYATLSVIQDKIERGLQLDWMLPQKVGKGVVFYNRKDVLEWALREQNINLLGGICFEATQEGRIDVLDEVWNNIDHEGEFWMIFEELDEHATRGGRLNVLKWYETKGKDIDKDMCATLAARDGHLNILQWLREEKSFEFGGKFYCRAVEGGRLHVMKWLREIEVPWTEGTFSYSAWGGNPDILQWLHDEGCPWPRGDAHRVYADGLQPELVDWLHANGYGDRIE